VLAELRERRQLAPLNDGPAGQGQLPRMPRTCHSPYTQ